MTAQLPTLPVPHGDDLAGAALIEELREQEAAQERHEAFLARLAAERIEAPAI